MPEAMPARLYEGVPTTSAAALFTATCRTVITTIHASGDATGGTVTLSVVPAGGSAAAGNRVAQAFPVGAAASEDVLAAGETIEMNAGDFISGLQSSGTHITVTIEGETYGEA
jgi:hypothetical protein